MIIYPILTTTFNLDHIDTGVFLGGKIHDIAQVVGAGFSVSQETGETATLVKLIRVTMLASVVLVFSLVIRRLADKHGESSKRLPIAPYFVLVFLVFDSWSGDFLDESMVLFYTVI